MESRVGTMMTDGGGGLRAIAGKPVTGGGDVRHGWQTNK